MVSKVFNTQKKHNFRLRYNILYYEKARVKWHKIQSIWEVEEINIYHRVLQNCANWKGSIMARSKGKKCHYVNMAKWLWNVLPKTHHHDEFPNNCNGHYSCCMAPKKIASNESN